MSSLSVTDFPVEVIEEILLFVPSPRAICRVGATCSVLSAFVSTNERVWDFHYKQRWTTGEQESFAFSHGVASDAATTFSLQDYRRRHEDDGSTLSQLMQVTAEVALVQDYDLGREYTTALWTTLLRSSVQSMDILRVVANNRGDAGANNQQRRMIWDWYSYSRSVIANGTLSHVFHDSLPSPLCRSLAAQSLDRIHFRYVMHKLEDLVQLINNQQERIARNTEEPRSSTMSSSSTLTSTSLLEEGALLIATSVWTWQDVVSQAPTTRIGGVKGTLHRLANTLHNRLDHSDRRSACTSTSRTLRAVVLLSEIMNDEGFRGNVENYYNVRNSAIDNVLLARMGIPLTLAVIYKCILQRVHVDVNIIGLPGHVVLGIPNERDVFVDVFDGGRILSLDDCRKIAQLCRVIWRPEYTRPLYTREVMMRMLRNVENCQARTVRESRTTGAYVSMVRTVALRTFLQRFHWRRFEMLPPIGQSDPDPWPFMDPAIFRHYNVINDDTMRRHTEAPFLHFQIQAEE